MNQRAPLPISLLALAVAAVASGLAFPSQARADGETSGKCPDSCRDLPVDDPNFEPNLTRGRYFVDGVGNFNRTSIIDSAHSGAVASVFTLNAGTALQYFVFDRFSIGPSSIYHIVRGGELSGATWSSGISFNAFPWRHKRMVFKTGAGFFLESALPLGGRLLGGQRYSGSVGLQYFFLPSVATGPTFSLDLVSGDRYRRNLEFSFGGGTTFYL